MTLVVVAGAGVFVQQQVTAELRHETHDRLETTVTVEASELDSLLTGMEETNTALERAAASHGGTMDRAADGDLPVRMGTAACAAATDGGRSRSTTATRTPNRGCRDD